MLPFQSTNLFPSEGILATLLKSTPHELLSFSELGGIRIPAPTCEIVSNLLHVIDEHAVHACRIIIPISDCGIAVGHIL
jgi:hypothetical protein